MMPDYDKAVWESINILEDCDFNTIPIDLDVIFSRYKRTVKKCSYSRFSKKYDLTIADTCEYFESDLGACAYDKRTERYIIYYNDTKPNYGLDKFTIAHELGHVFLNHHAEVDSDVLLRKPIKDKKYDKLEKEANCFARNLLAPVPLVDEYIDIDSGFYSQQLQEAFGISLLASLARPSFLILDRYRMTPNSYKYFNSFDIKFDYYCSNCANTDIYNSNYCKICGIEHRLFEKIHGKFYDEEIETNEDNRVIKCPVCENEEFTEGLYYCRICGTERYNYCSDNDNCGQVNDGNARYCKYCGSKTVYLNKGILEKIK